jgi:hypothetical protein
MIRNKQQQDLINIHYLDGETFPLRPDKARRTTIVPFETSSSNNNQKTGVLLSIIDLVNHINTSDS